MSSPLRVLLATSNGSGMGHLTRQLAVALAAGDRWHPTGFSMSMAVPVVASTSVPVEYCPSYERCWMPRTQWQRYLRDRLVALVEETQAQVVVFDGVNPYPGLRLARRRLPDVAFVWSRRGMWTPGFNDRGLDGRYAFDAVIEPGDLAGAADVGPTAALDDAIRVPPVSLLDVLPLLPRAEAARALGLDPDRPTALVSLGSGRLREVSAALVASVRALLSAEADLQVAVTRSQITRTGLPLTLGGRVREVRGVYPLATHLSAFDLAVSAAGYNSVHELLPAGVPTLLLPNSGSTTDDQDARARGLVTQGLALAADPLDLDAVGAACRELAEPEARLRLATALRDGDGAAHGAQAFAAAVDEVAAGFHGAPRPWRRELADTQMLARDRAQWAVTRLAGPQVRRALGRRPDAAPRNRIAVRLVEEPAGTPADSPLPTLEPPLPLVLTERLDTRLLRSGTPYEHLLAGSSRGYRTTRLALARQHYQVLPTSPG